MPLLQTVASAVGFRDADHNESRLHALRDLLEVARREQVGALVLPGGLRNVPGPERVVSIGGSRVGVLLCGELFSPQARTSIAERGVGGVVDLGRTGMGQGLIGAMKSLSRQAKCAVVHTQHVTSWWTPSMHHVDRRASQCSVPIRDRAHVGNDSFRVAHLPREL